MATTINPLVWEFSSDATPNAVNLGTVAHYYDEQAQNIVIDNTGNIRTKTYTVDDGHWRQAVVDRPNVQVTTGESFSKLRFDHPLNGLLMGASISPGKLEFLRYSYAMDISSLVEDYDMTSQIDNSIYSISATVQNIGAFIFNEELTLFQPGSRIRLGFRVGDSGLYLLGIFWLDEAVLDIASPTISISGRNTVGFKLRDQTFDDNVIWNSIGGILEYAGITRYMVQAFTPTMATFQFKPEDTLLEGLQLIIDYYTTADHILKLVELPDGTILFGYSEWIAERQPNGYYTFNEGSDLFKRKTSKIADSSYTSLRITGRDSSNNDLTPVTVAVTAFPYWGLGKHKTKHITAPDGFTQSELAAWANTQANIYRYIGIGEDFVGPFRPRILVGDIAEVVDGTVGISLGLITEIRQVFSRDASTGYRTEFTVDSGGISTDGEDYVIYSRAAEASGFNRRQRMVDIIRFVSNK